MRRFSRTEQRAYRRSNKIETMGIIPSSGILFYVCELRVALAEEDQEMVSRAGQGLLNQLSEQIGVTPAKLKVKDKANVRFKKGKSGRKRAVWKLYGTCNNQGEITVAFRTAVQRKVFAFKTFLNTVLHEFCHHVDYQKLNLRASYHTRGFYSRLDSVYRPILERLGER